jgi:hypothetical protein
MKQHKTYRATHDQWRPSPGGLQVSDLRSPSAARDVLHGVQRSTTTPSQSVPWLGPQPTVQRRDTPGGSGYSRKLMTTLGAVLINPPTGSGTRTIRHLRVAAELLDCDSVEIANLFSVATRDVTGINEAGRSADGWSAAQPRLRQVIAESDCLIAGWGVGGLSGAAAMYQRIQLDYVRLCAREFGLDHIWTINGEPRHPSRWHQYVSDRHGRATGTCLGERIALVLTSVPFTTLCRRTSSAAESEIALLPAPLRTSGIWPARMHEELA